MRRRGLGWADGGEGDGCSMGGGVNVANAVCRRGVGWAYAVLGADLGSGRGLGAVDGEKGSFLNGILAIYAQVGGRDGGFGGIYSGKWGVVKKMPDAKTDGRIHLI